MEGRARVRATEAANWVKCKDMGSLKLLESFTTQGRGPWAGGNSQLHENANNNHING